MRIAERAATTSSGSPWSPVVSRTPGCPVPRHRSARPRADEQAGHYGRWGALFPGQIPGDIRPLKAVEEPIVDIEGHAIRLIEAGHSDTRDTTCVRVPKLDLVAGDGRLQRRAHPHLGDRPAARRRVASDRPTPDEFVDPDAAAAP